MFLSSTSRASRCCAAWAKSSSSSLLASSTSAERDSARRNNSQHRVILLPEIPLDTAATNPLLRPYTEGLPKLDAVSESNAYYGLGKALLEYESAIVQMDDKCRVSLAAGTAPDFDDLFAPLEKVKCHFEGVWSTVNLLNMVSDVLDRDRAATLHRRAERAFASIHGSRTIFDALVAMRERHDSGQAVLDSDRLRILERYLLEYKHQGYGIGEKKFEELNNNWMKRLAIAKNDYSYKTQWMTELFRSTVSDANVVRDFPLDVLKAMSLDSSQPAKGPWSITLHPYMYRKFLEYCPDRALRWNVYQAKVSVGSATHDVASNVSGQVRDVRQYRQDQAATLGFANFADMSMETKMAANVENVHSMVACLLGKAKEAQERELTALQDYAESRGFEDELAIFDVPFFKRKQRRTALGIIDEDLRDFFPLPRVMNGIFSLCSQMFDVHFEEVKKESTSVWNQSVKLFRVTDASGSVLGHFYFDPYIRDDKGFMGSDRGWYVPIRGHSIKGSCEPLGAMVLSLPTPGYGKPCLITVDEVQELMRQFGNLLLHMSATSPWSDLCGKQGIEWDAIDVSQHFMIEWLYTPDFLASVSGHWSTNEPISPGVVDSICSSRHHMAGFELCTELFKAAYDISFFTEDLDSEGTQDIVRRLYPQYVLLEADRDDSFPYNFTEVLGGNQSAAYYCNTWAKMLAADAFSAVHEVGLENKDEVKKVCKRFRSTFLASGSALPAAEVFRKFRGRDPSHEALLLTLGLKEMPKPKKKGQQIP